MHYAIHAILEDSFDVEHSAFITRCGPLEDSLVIRRIQNHDAPPVRRIDVGPNGLGQTLIDKGFFEHLNLSLLRISGNTFSFPDTITTGYPLLENYHLKMRQLVFLL